MIMRRVEYRQADGKLHKVNLNEHDYQNLLDDVKTDDDGLEIRVICEWEVKDD